MKFLLSLVTLLLSGQFSIAQQINIIRPDGKKINTEEIDQLVQRLMGAADVTGLFIGVVQDNQPTFTKGYGFRNKTKNLFNTNKTSLYAASFTKSLFAYLTMQLADQRMIDLDKPLYQYLSKPLPEYEDYKDLAGDDRWKLITARHCLSHTTGFPNWRFLNPNGHEKLEIFFTPGSRYAYSGEGLVLLQMVIEKITGQDIQALAEKNIFQPFSLSHTSFTWKPEFEQAYANGHSYEQDTFAIRKRSKPNGAGSMQTTITDYTGFMAAVLQGKGLSATGKKAMLSPQISIHTKHQFPSLNNDTTSQNDAIQLSYGLGWGLFKTNHGWAFFKEGHSDDGWEHYTIAFPDKKSAFVIMSNSMNAEGIYKELVTFLTGVTIPWEWEGYTPYKPVLRLTEAELQQYVGEYEGQLKARFTLENGLLRVEAPAENLPRTGVYPTGNNHFFLKLIPISLEFLKNDEGKIDRVKVIDGQDQFELKKIIPAAGNGMTIKVSPIILLSYAGTYRLKGQSRTLKVELKKDKLLINLSGKDFLELNFITETKFKAVSIMDIKGEFTTTDGKVNGLIIEQGGKFEWDKIK